MGRRGSTRAPPRQAYDRLAAVGLTATRRSELILRQLLSDLQVVLHRKHTGQSVRAHVR